MCISVCLMCDVCVCHMCTMHIIMSSASKQETDNTNIEGGRNTASYSAGKEGSVHSVSFVINNHDANSYIVSISGYIRLYHIGMTFQMAALTNINYAKISMNMFPHLVLAL